MTCQQVQTMLDGLTLPRLQAKKYTTLHSHLQSCEPCEHFWERWLRQEQQLVSYLTVAQTPTDLWEHIMAQVEIHEPAHTRGAVSDKISVDMSSQGVQRLVLHQTAHGEMTTDSPFSAVAMSPLLTRVHTQLDEYFRGERAIFQLPVDLGHCSDFERAVLEATTAIPYGKVRSYKWIAERIGRPRAMRAVGNALHKNPVPIVIPCHRVVKTDGSMGGYAYGEAWKVRLLTLERETTFFVGCSSTRILCYRGCHHERRIRNYNRIHFAHFNEAVECGYRPCTVCQPDTTSDQDY